MRSMLLYLGCGSGRVMKNLLMRLSDNLRGSMINENHR